MSKNCQKCGAVCADSEAFCHQCGTQLVSNGAVPEMYACGPTPGMKWYKFIIYFQLFANAVLNVINGFAYLTGFSYGEDADWIYSFMPVLKTADIAMGLLMLGCAAFAIAVRMMLAKYRKNAVKAYLIFLAVVVLIPFVYSIFVGIAFGEASVLSTILPSVIVGLVWIPVNAVYFGKRKHLFTN